MMGTYTIKRQAEHCADHLEEAPRDELDLLAARLLRQLGQIHQTALTLTNATGFRDRQVAFDELVRLMQDRSLWRKRQQLRTDNENPFERK